MTRNHLAALITGCGLVYLGVRYIITVASPPPGGIGLNKSRLIPVHKPGCVSSQASNTSHYIAPFAYSGPVEEACAKLLNVIASIQRGTVITAHPHYIHAEFRSLLFGFIDDVEFFLHNGLIELRSTARLSLAGTNRQRLETIQLRFDVS